MAKTAQIEHRDWYEAIAERSKLSLEDTQTYLQQLQIRPAPQLPRPKFLKIQKVSFSGKKTGEKHNGETFSFCWGNLSPGVWCLGSHKNFAGKSSVLEVLLWALRGKPKNLQQDIRQWLSQVEVIFNIDADVFSVRFNVNQGRPEGVLLQLVADKEHNLFAFNSDDTFENTMARFMLETLSLEQMPARRTHPGDTDQQTVWNSWSSFSSIFYVGGDHEYLLGDVPVNGMPGRLLKLFAGLPWATTHALALAAQSQVEQEERNRTRRAEEDKKAHEAAIHQLEQDLKAAQGQLAELTAGEKDFLTQLDSSLQEISRLSTAKARLQRSISDLETELHTASQASVSDAQASLDIRETLLAQRVFNGLRPTCCPRCDQKITAVRFRQEEEGGTCSVCTGVLVAAEEDYETNLQGVEERASASESAVKEIKQRLEALRDEQATNQDDLRNAQKQFAELDQQRSSFVQRRELELRVAKLEGALEERRKSRTVRESLDNPLLAVAKAAVQETKARVDNLKTTFFEPLNDEIVSFGKSFGITQLERCHSPR